MQFTEVVVVVKNPATRYLVMEMLKQHGLKFAVRDSLDSYSDLFSVVITDSFLSSSSQEGHFVIVNDATNIESILIITLVNLKGLKHATWAAIGVDPGFRFGIALVMDGILVYSLTSPSIFIALEKTIAWISLIRKRFPTTTLSVRVGNGSRPLSTLYIRSLRNHYDDIPIELVDEQNTTLKCGSFTDQHAAMLIAQRQGRPVCEKYLSLGKKSGYIHAIKRLFLLSEKNNFISNSDITKLLSGELTLEDLKK